MFDFSLPLKMEEMAVSSSSFFSLVDVVEEVWAGVIFWFREMVGELWVLWELGDRLEVGLE